jgi:hypothetical protein
MQSNSTAQNTALNQLYFGMLIVDMNAVKLPGEAHQTNLPPKYGQLIDVGDAVNNLPACDEQCRVL